jgi:hypothetical protein
LDAILDPGTNLIHGAKRSNYIERTPGYAIGVLDAYGVGRRLGEVMVIVNAYGINSMTIDTVLECKRRNITTIAVTSSSFAKIVPPGAKSRHPSGRNLFEEADIFIDNHLPVGDAVLHWKAMIKGVFHIDILQLLRYELPDGGDCRRNASARHRAAGVYEREYARWGRTQPFSGERYGGVIKHLL